MQREEKLSTGATYTIARKGGGEIRTPRRFGLSKEKGKPKGKETRLDLSCR